MYFSYLIFALIITLVVTRKIVNEYQYRQEIGYNYTAQDVKWSPCIIISYPIYAFISGTMAGLLGIDTGVNFRSFTLRFWFTSYCLSSNLQFFSIIYCKLYFNPVYDISTYLIYNDFIGHDEF